MTIKKEAPVRRTDTIKEYVKNLSEEDWRFLQNRLSQRLGGDLTEAVTFLEKNPEIDRFLGAASSNSDYYNRIDHIEAMIQGDSKRRSTTSPRR